MRSHSWWGKMKTCKLELKILLRKSYSLNKKWNNNLLVGITLQRYLAQEKIKGWNTAKIKSIKTEPLWSYQLSQRWAQKISVKIIGLYSGSHNK